MPPESDQTIADSAPKPTPWQFSLGSLFMFTAAVALLLGIGKMLGEAAFVVHMLALLVVVSILAYTTPSQIARMLVWLILRTYPKT